jgi:hypothetical protein
MSSVLQGARLLFAGQFYKQSWVMVYPHAGTRFQALSHFLKSKIFPLFLPRRLNDRHGAVARLTTKNICETGVARIVCVTNDPSS